MSLTIEAVPCLNDNYAYLVHDPQIDARTWVVDPSAAAPVRAAIAAAKLELAGVLATHHHHDHVGGIAALVDAHPGRNALPVFGFAGDAARIPKISERIDAPLGSFVASGHSICGLPLEAMHIPGHTTGAVAWKLADNVFTGDTLFAAGCGRLFEGTPAMMFDSLRAICALPPATKLWFGHEYTAANLRFAATVEAENAAIDARAASLGPCTTPTSVERELATNPFVRARDAAHFAERRSAKDSFAG